MGKASTVILTLILILAVGLGINYAVNHYGSFNYEWKRGFTNYNTYNLAGNSVLNGYIKADGDVSVYILTKENFKKMKNGEPFSYYKAWEHVRSVEFDGIKIPDGDYILVVKNEGEGMRWISAKIVNKKE
ncbi:hypothetical protein, conserved [Thermococcus kodakarensis KOD1]|uniref:Uncharacterized protein n=1 Tax=Thermococcus kodakarensis (strain ATCC BAA-918 / JCM 12380 / KOD1) TaxID=69014 RepID=Q5JEP6_THEKO|nr:hypothetical protein [Thermococcus kodakarensis]WCN27774.1 hypothetical protein POG15_09530 [Thermococcus kodakarensis]WCN30068.1 hypothetical protein POG21_09515 [Thermococcus kodakarensis]BAD86060.1 hypothetical protein, conserved [Thermococcus kodakarensis KOD1]